MKKKYFVPTQDKKDWADYVEKMNNISVKDSDILKEEKKINRVRKLDLHGHSLDSANQLVKKFITESFNNNYKRLLIVTGKGLRSKSYDNPYISQNFSVLKNSIPEYIRNDENLNSIISKITQADKKDGGEGAIDIYLKDNKKFTK